MWWRQETSDCARIDAVGRETSDQARVDTVEVADERSGPKRRGGGRRRVFALELTWWGRETSDQA